MKLSHFGLSKNNALLLIPLIIAPFLMGTSFPEIPLEESADVIVLIVPANDHALHMSMAEERSINGRITRVDKGNLPSTPVIVHPANSFTGPLKQGIPHKIFLKKFPNRDAYYIIGGEPVQAGGGK